MGRFAENLESKLNSHFIGFYIDYGWLKQLIRETQNVIEEDSNNKDACHSKAQSFAAALDFNINRAVTFYEEKLEESVTKLTNVRRKWVYLSPQTLPQIHEQLKDVAKGVRDCLVFVEVNVETLKRILQNVDKIFNDSTEKEKAAIKKPTHKLDREKRAILSQDEFLRSRLRPDRETKSKLESLRVYKGLDKIAEELRRRCDAIRSLEASWLEQGIIDPSYVRRVHSRKDTLPLLVQLYENAQHTVQETRWYYGLVAQANVDYEKEPVGEADFWGLFLNNYNTLLYLANYYSVIPSASLYAEALGLPPVVSGLLLAMAPLSALLSSILYSVWSNRSFKQPLIFCSLLLILGNFMYAIALDYKSIWLLFTGRLLVGLGGNRAVNRRYIADFVPVKDRTYHSALFVAIGSLGMSLGPGCQYFFHMMNFKLPYLGYTVNVLTSPGWIMVALWFLFAFQVMIHFREPIRRYAQRRRDSRGLLQPLLTESFPTEIIVFPSSSPTPLPPTLNATSNTARPMNMNDGEHQPKSTAVDTDWDGTVTCLWIYFVLKLTQEAFQTAAPMFTSFAYQWSDTDVGYLLALIGLIVLPSNLLIGWISKYIHDRTLNLLSLILLGIGVTLTVNWFTDQVPVTLHYYVFGAIIVFLSAQCLEAVSMSLLSKVMPKVMSKGLLNSGFLSTESGTFGRVVGAALITLIGSISELMGIISVIQLQKMVMIPCIALVAVSIVICFWKWETLLPISERLGRNVADDADSILKSDVWKRLPELRPLCVQIQEIADQARTQQETKLVSSIRHVQQALHFIPSRSRGTSSQ